VNLDLLDEVREQAHIKSEASKRRVKLRQTTKVRPRQFQVVDLVMRKAHPYQLENKLSPKWTWPFRVVEVLRNGAYKLETLEGGPIPRTWNVVNLKFILVKLIFVVEQYGAEMVMLFFPWGILKRSPNKWLFTRYCCFLLSFLFDCDAWCNNLFLEEVFWERVVWAIDYHW